MTRISTNHTIQLLRLTGINKRLFLLLLFTLSCSKSIARQQQQQQQYCLSSNYSPLLHPTNSCTSSTSRLSRGTASALGGGYRRRPRTRPTRYYRPQQQRDYSAQFITVDEFKKEKRARLWNVNMASRKPGKFSLTSKLVLANIVAYAAQVFFPSVTQMGVKISDKILRGEQLYRLVTPIFLHGGLGHLFTNMYSLQRVGNDVEKLFGSGRYLASYMLAGIAGNYLSALQSPNPSLGASGSVFGIVGAYYVFLNRNDWIMGSYGQSMTDSITQTIAINMLVGALNPMVDNWGHLGGAIGGAAMAYWIGPRLFLMNLPNDTGKVVIDKPLYRLPRQIESIPESLNNGFQKITGQISQITGIGGRYQSSSSSSSSESSSSNDDKPWRQNQQQQNFNQRRRVVPNRSIKPRDV